MHVLPFFSFRIRVVRTRCNTGSACPSSLSSVSLSVITMRDEFRRLLIAVCVALMVNLPVAAQQISEATFETASIRAAHLSNGCSSLPPAGSSHFDATCISLRTLLQLALVYDSGLQLEGNQKALDVLYDIRASTTNNVPWTYVSVRPMLRQLLTERFHLAYHYGSKSVPGYEMTVVKGGTKLVALETTYLESGVKAGEASRNAFMPGRIQGRELTSDAIAGFLAVVAEHPVVNRTDLGDRYNMDLRFAPNDTTPSDLPSFFTAVKEQLGLELKPASVTVKTIVVDRIDDTPTEN